MEYFAYGVTNTIPRSFDQNEIQIESYIPVITKQDRMQGYITRYFARPSNQHDGEIMEISKTTYDRVKSNPFYICVSIEWRISGDLEDKTPTISTPNSPRLQYTGVVTANRLSLELANETLPGMNHQITNMTQFHTT